MGIGRTGFLVLLGELIAELEKVKAEHGDIDVVALSANYDV